jgi:PAS domain S-box-containing protein
VYAHFEGSTDYYEDEYRVKTKSGEWKWIFSRGKVVERDLEGRPLRMAGTYQDITSRKQTEEALRQSEERYRTVADFTYDWEYWIDLSGIFLYVSPSCERITGYAANEFLDDPGLFERIVHPDDVPLVTTHWQEARKGEPTKTYCFDFRIIHSDGEVRWINHACQPVCGEGGGPLGRRACNRDITDRKIAENALIESQGMLESILAAVPVGIALHRNREIQWANEAWEKMFGFTGQHEYVGQHTRIMHQSDVEYDLAREALYEGLEAGAVREVDAKLRRNDGSVFSSIL